MRKIAGCACAGNPGNIFPAAACISDPDMHHGTCVTHVPWCMLGSLTSGFLWSGWRGKRSRHSRRMRNPQFCLSGKRPISPIHTLHAAHFAPSHHPYCTLCAVIVSPMSCFLAFSSWVRAMLQYIQPVRKPVDYKAYLIFIYIYHNDAWLFRFHNSWWHFHPRKSAI